MNSVILTPLQFALSISTEIVLRFDKHVQSCNCHQNLEYHVYLPHQKSLMSPSQPHPQPSQPLTCFLPCVCVRVCVCAHAQSCNHVQLFATPRTAAHQAPLSMGFSRQEYWRELHFLLQGIFLTCGMNPGLLQCLLSYYERLLFRRP